MSASLVCPGCGIPLAWTLALLPQGGTRAGEGEPPGEPYPGLRHSFPAFAGHAVCPPVGGKSNSRAHSLVRFLEEAHSALAERAAFLGASPIPRTARYQACTTLAAADGVLWRRPLAPLRQAVAWRSALSSRERELPPTGNLSQTPKGLCVRATQPLSLVLGPRHSSLALRHGPLFPRPSSLVPSGATRPLSL